MKFLRHQISTVLLLISEICEIKMPQKILFYLSREIEMSENKAPRLKCEIKMLQKTLKTLRK